MIYVLCGFSARLVVTFEKRCISEKVPYRFRLNPFVRESAIFIDIVVDIRDDFPYYLLKIISKRCIILSMPLRLRQYLKKPKIQDSDGKDSRSLLFF